MRVWLAVKCFFKVLFDAEFAHCIRQQAEGSLAQHKPQEPAPAVGVTSAAMSQRNDAIALLATLQREARFVDIVSESLDGHSDAQIGAAAHDVLRDSGKVLDRLFSLQPVVDAEEGKSVEVPAGYDAGRYRLTGNVSRAATHGAIDACRLAGHKMRTAGVDRQPPGRLNCRTSRSRGGMSEGNST